MYLKYSLFNECEQFSLPIFYTYETKSGFSYSHCLRMKNQRMTEVKRDFWRLSGPTSLFQQGHLKPVVRDHVQVAFD